MASKKTTELEVMTGPQGVSILYIIDDPLGTPTSKQISLDTFFANVPSNTNISATLTVSNRATFGLTNVNANLNVSGITTVGVLKTTSNGLIINNSLTPSNSTITIVKGKLFYDTNYLYIATAANTIKRIPLNSF